MNNTNLTTNFITGIRAIAVLMVFLVHSGGGGLSEISDLGKTIVYWGRYGVEIFFVISGFTIFYQFYEKDYNKMQFILIRFLRISIPYYPILIFCFLMMYFKFQEPIYWMNKFNESNIEIKNLLYHMLYLGGFNLKYINTLIGVEWTLYIEMIMYLIFFILIGFNIIRFNIINTLLFVIVLYSIQLYINEYLKLDPLLFHWSFIKYFYMFILGGLAYLVRKKFDNFDSCILTHSSNISIIFLFVLFFANAKYNLFKDIEEFFSIITFIAIIFIRDNSFLAIFFNNRLFLFLGIISYSFYLWHAIVLGFDLFIIDSLKQFIFINFLYSFLMSTLLAYIWYLIFEQKIYAGIKRYFFDKFKNETN